MIKFYIVTPSYNASKYIDETIISVVTQAGNFEIYYHIQDGGSSDGTLNHIRRWQEILATPSPLIRCQGVHFSWQSESDAGMYDAINKGFSTLNIPNAGIMAWINADDVYFQYSFSTAAKAFSDIKPLEWLGGVTGLLHDSETFEPCPDYSAPYPTEIIRSYCCDDKHWRVLQQNGMFWKNSLWEKAGGLDISLRYAGDFALWPRFAEHAPFVHYPFTMGTFRIRAGQLSRHRGYAEEMSLVCPDEKRDLSLKQIQRSWGPLMAPQLTIDKDGKNFFLSTKKVWPPSFVKRSRVICVRLPRLSLAMRLWLPRLHDFMKGLPRKIRSLLPLRPHSK